MKTIIKTVLILVIIVMTLWTAATVSDMIGCSKYSEPVFAIKKDVAGNESNNGIYQGLGYIINISKHADEIHGTKIDSTSMKLFGLTIIQRGIEEYK